ADTVKQDAGLKFKDVLVPRVGFEYRVDKDFSLIGGVSYEQSPLDSDQSIDVNYVDNDRIVMGLGLSWLIRQPMLLSQPLRIDLGYQYHLLQDRDFRLASTRNAASGECNGQTDSHGNPLRCEDVTSGGNVHVINASVNLKF
ncbi:MAG: outer membrane protein transport protein, partial [Perlucidibaca sp.]